MDRLDNGNLQINHYSPQIKPQHRGLNSDEVQNLQRKGELESGR